MKGTIVFSIRNKFGMPVSKANIEIKNSCYKFKGTTDNTGLSVIYNVPFGVYLIRISKASFKESICIIRFCKCPFIIKINLRDLGYRCVHGVIKDDKTNINVDNATVVLYTENAELIPINYTKTDCSGYYEFDNIPPGKYLIKSIK